MAIVATFAAVGWLFLYSLDHGVPLVEGDQFTRSGAAFGFEIGSSRSEAFRIIRERYAQPGNDLRVVWERASPVHTQLAKYENPDSRQWTSEKFSHWRQPVSALSELIPPLQLVDRWDIELPGNWVNDIYLTFSDDHLTEVQRSRWLFERP